MSTFADVPGLTSVDACRELAALAGQVPAGQAIVEIGVFKGRTLCALASGARDGLGAHVWGVDPWEEGRHSKYGYHEPETRLAAESNVADCGLADQVTLVRGWASREAFRWAGPPVGLLFLDGNHRQAGSDILAWLPRLAERAWVVADDYHPRFRRVVADVDRLVADGTLELDGIRCDRLAVMRRPV